MPRETAAGRYGIYPISVARILLVLSASFTATRGGPSYGQLSEAGGGPGNTVQHGPDGSAEPGGRSFFRFNSYTCGIRPYFWSSNALDRVISQYVIGGGPAFPKQYPFFVTVTTTFELLYLLAPNTCGGSLVTTKHVITAAHCLYNKMKASFASPLQVKVHAAPSWYFLGLFFPHPLPVLPYQVIPHPEFNSSSLRADIAILALTLPLTLAPGVSPVCLPSSAAVALPTRGGNTKGYNVIEARQGEINVLEIAGFGAKNEGQRSITNMLQFGLMKIQNRTICQAESGVYFDESHICARGLRNSTITCFGDSGGPLVSIVQGRMTLAGVSSFVTTSTCLRDGFSGYTNITFALPWILESLGTTALPSFRKSRSSQREGR